MSQEKLLSLEERRTKYSVPALEKALDVLEYLSEQAVPLTQAQLARALKRQSGEIFRMLACLESRGYLRREPATGAYSLTLKLFELSRTHSPYELLLKVAEPLMRALAEELRASGAVCFQSGADVSDRRAVRAAIDALAAELGPVDLLRAAGTIFVHGIAGGQLIPGFQNNQPAGAGEAFLANILVAKRQRQRGQHAAFHLRHLGHHARLQRRPLHQHSGLHDDSLRQHSPIRDERQRQPHFLLRQRHQQPEQPA